MLKSEDMGSDDIETLIRSGFAAKGCYAPTGLGAGSVGRALRHRTVRRLTRGVTLTALLVSVGLVMMHAREPSLPAHEGHIPLTAQMNDGGQLLDNGTVANSIAHETSHGNCKCVPIPKGASRSLIHAAIEGFAQDIGMERATLTKTSRTGVNFSISGNVTMDAATIERCASVLFGNYDVASVSIVDGRVNGLSLTRLMP